MPSIVLLGKVQHRLRSLRIAPHAYHVASCRYSLGPHMTTRQRVERVSEEGQASSRSLVYISDQGLGSSAFRWVATLVWFRAYLACHGSYTKASLDLQSTLKDATYIPLLRLYTTSSPNNLSFYPVSVPSCSRDRLRPCRNDIIMKPCRHRAYIV